MIEFDYEYYLKILEFIKNSSETINEGIEDLIEETIKLREKSYIKVAPLSYDISEVRIGNNFIFEPAENKMYFNEPVKLQLNDNVVSVKDPIYTDDFVIKKDFKDTYIKYLSTLFLSNNEASNTYLKLIYEDNTADSDEFKENNVPSLKWFKKNYVTKKDKSVESRIIVDKSLISSHSSLTVGNLNELAGIKLIDKTVNIYLESFCSINDEVLIIPNNVNINPNAKISVEFIQTQTSKMEKFNSVVTDEGIKNTFIAKDLSNLKKINIKNNNEQDSIHSLESYINYCRNESFIEDNILKVKQDVVLHLFNEFPIIVPNTISNIIYDFVNRDILTKKDIIIFLYQITGVNFSDVVKLTEEDKELLKNAIPNTKKIEGIPASVNLIDFIYYTMSFLFTEQETFSFKNIKIIENPEHYYDKNDYVFNYCMVFKNPEYYVTKNNLTNYVTDMNVSTTNSKAL
jgi:hypothetical protein